MIIIVSILIVVALVVIVVLKGQTPTAKITREDFLARIEELVEGKREPIEGMNNSYRVPFTFEGYRFIYEDVETLGFSGKIQKIHIKHQMDNHFHLVFSEKMVSSTIQSDITLASEIETQAVNKSIKIPNSLSRFNIQTNNPELANRLFQNDKVLSVINSFKNTDERGRPFISFRIIDGVLALHFHSIAHFKPSVHSLMSETSTLENYLDKILMIAQALK